jgi:hypothetical protein
MFLCTIRHISKGEEVRQTSKRRIILAAATLAATGFGALAQSLPNTAIAVSGMAAPGRPGGVVFSTIGPYFAIRDGTIAFQAYTTEPGARSFGAWLLKDNVLSQPIYSDQHIVDVPNETISGASFIDLNSSGNIAFESSGIYEWRNGSVYRIVTGNTPIPGADSGTIGIVGPPSINERGNVAFRAGSGLYTDAFGSGLQLIAPTGQSAPGGGTYRLFDQVVLSGDRITTSGQSYIFGISCTALYSFTPNSSELIAATKNPAPLLPDYIADSFERIFINAVGHLTFPAFVYNPSNPGDRFRVLYSENATGLHTVLQTGQPAPGVPGMTLSEIGNSTSSNNDRVLAFTFLNDGRRALFASDTTYATHLVALTGQSAPDLPDGITFGQDFSTYAIGDTGTVGFIVDLNDTAGVLSSHRAFFAANPQGVIHLVAYIGETISAGPGLPNWTVSDIQFQNEPPDGAMNGDELLYRLSFAGGRTGLYTTIVPESANPFTATGGSWNTAANWTYDIPSAAGAVAHLLTQSAPTTITLDGDKTVATLLLDSPAPYTLNPGAGGALTFANYGNTATLQAKQGQHTLAVPLNFTDPGTIDIAPGAKISATAGVSVAAGKTLTKIGNGTLEITGGLAHATGATTDLTAGELHVDQITGNGTLKIRSGATARLTAQGLASSVKELSIDGGAGAWLGALDIGQAGLVINYPAGASPLLTIVDQIKSAKASGWTGPGIGSTAASEDPTTAIAVAEASVLLALSPGETATFMGQEVGPDSLLIRYTKMGDATMDGNVNFADLVTVAQHYGITVADGGWAEGDFNYDGQVNFADLVAVAQNYGSSLEFSAPPAPSESSVPEPAALPIIGIMLAQLLRRRKTRSLVTP